MSVVIDLDRGIDAAEHREVLLTAILTGDHEGEVLLGGSVSYTHLTLPTKRIV